MSNLLAGEFSGIVHPVNRQADPVEGLRSYRSVSDVPGDVDLALLAVPAERMTEVVRECGVKGVRGLVVVTSGETGPQASETGQEASGTGQEASETGQEASGTSTDSRLVELARNFGMRLVGPNSMGVINTCPRVRMNATFVEQAQPPGSVAFSSQSGGLGIALLGELAVAGSESRASCPLATRPT